MGNRYAVELYSVHKELQNDLWGTLRKVKKMGYEGVEFFWQFTRTAQELRAALEDAELVCCGWHTPWHYLSDANLMGTITYNKLLGNTDIVVPGLPDEMTCSKDAWLKTAEAFNAAAERLADYGMHLGYHNHDSEFKLLDGERPFYLFYDNTERVGMQLDNGNALHAGSDEFVYDPLTRYPLRAKTLHLKPYSLKNGFNTMIGEDDINWPKFFDLSYTTQDVEWYIVEYECEEAYSQLDGVDVCLKKLKEMERGGDI